MSLFRLANQLQQAQTPSPRGHSRWNMMTVRNILQNPVYTGTAYAQRLGYQPCQQRRSPLAPVSVRKEVARVIRSREHWMAVATLPALIDREQFEQVQEKMKQNQGWARRNNTAQQYLLRALVSCGTRGLACTGYSRPPQYRYYRCRGKGDAVNSCQDQKCTAPTISAVVLDALVGEDLCAVLQAPEQIRQALERAHAGSWWPQEWQARQETMRRAQASLEQQTERLTEEYLSGVLPLAE